MNTSSVVNNSVFVIVLATCCLRKTTFSFKGMHSMMEDFHCKEMSKCLLCVLHSLCSLDTVCSVSCPT